MERVKQCKPDAIPNSEILVRDQFCENVRDHMLHRELERLVRDRQTMTLLEVRREATQWVEEGQPNREKQVRSSVHTYEAHVVPSCEAIGIQQSAELRIWF